MSIPDGEVYSLTAAAMSAAKRLSAVDYTGRSDELRRAVTSELVWTINRLQDVIAALDPAPADKPLTARQIGSQIGEWMPAADTRVVIPQPLREEVAHVLPVGDADHDVGKRHAVAVGDADVVGEAHAATARA